MSTETISTCPCCQQAAASVWLKSSSISILSCECGHRYANGVLSSDELASQYYNEPELALEEKGESAKRSRFESDYYPLLASAGISPGKVLDIGCSTGSLLKLFHEKGWEVEGLEISPGPAAVAQKFFGESISIGSAERFLPRTDRYDLITLVHVLEHFRDPVSLLRLCRRSLRSGGAVLLEVPNAYDFLLKLWGAHYRPLCLGDHISFFTPQSLTNVAARAGLAVDRLSSPVRARDLIYPSMLSAVDLLRTSFRGRTEGGGTVSQQFRYRGGQRVAIRSALDTLAELVDPALAPLRRRVNRGSNGPVLLALMRVGSE